MVPLTMLLCVQAVVHTRMSLAGEGEAHWTTGMPKPPAHRHGRLRSRPAKAQMQHLCATEGSSPAERLSARAASTSSKSPTDPASIGPPDLIRRHTPGTQVHASTPQDQQSS